MQENKIEKTNPTDLDKIIELALPILKSNQESNLERIRLDHELAKMQAINDGKADYRNKFFVGSMLSVSIVSASLLGYFGKLNEGILTIFSMLIGGLFTAYATAIRYGAGKAKGSTKDDSQID